MPGFRPGKVPLKLVAQTYGPQVRSEVLSDAVQKEFTDAVKEANLKVAGYPKIEKKDPASKALEFNATFEIYPEVKVGDLAGASVERPQLEVDDAAVDKTIQILRKQRTRFEPVQRPARDGDRLVVDFKGTIDGQAFAGRRSEATSPSRWARAACCRNSRPRRAAWPRASRRLSSSLSPPITMARKLLGRRRRSP